MSDSRQTLPIRTSHSRLRSTRHGENAVEGENRCSASSHLDPPRSSLRRSYPCTRPLATTRPILPAGSPVRLRLAAASRGTSATNASPPCRRTSSGWSRSRPRPASWWMCRQNCPSRGQAAGKPPDHAPNPQTPGRIPSSPAQLSRTQATSTCTVAQITPFCTPWRMAAEIPDTAHSGGYLRLRVMDDRARRYPGFLDRGQGYGLPIMMRS
jgi:hypothetical protein